MVTLAAQRQINSDRPLSLTTRFSDGSEAPCSGLVRAAQKLDADAPQEVPLGDTFISRLLAEERIGWCVEEDKDGRSTVRSLRPGTCFDLVVGPDGQTSANVPDELWCDALGRVKIRFHWQQAEAPDERGSCWVRLLNRQAGPEMGWQWLPRGRLLTDPETSTWLSEKTWGEKASKMHWPNLWKTKDFHEQTASIDEGLVIGVLDGGRAGGLFRR